MCNKKHPPERTYVDKRGKEICRDCRTESARTAYLKRGRKLPKKLISVSESGCHEWIGYTDRDGYGKYFGHMVHRIAYELTHGEIPYGLTIDHLCRNRRCANPEHLEAVTLAENIRRGARYITHCPQGHPYDEVNTAQGDHSRLCRTCHREREGAKRARLRSEARDMQQ